MIDANEKIIDEIDCSKKWFFGNNETKRTMERKNALIEGNSSTNWQTSEALGGTPNNKNSIGQKIEDDKQKEEKSAITPSSSQGQSLESNLKEQNPFSSFLIALSIAVSSGAFVLFLKNKIEKEC